VAHELFERRGYAETSLEAIAGAVGISRTALFDYYKSKSDLVWGDYERNVAILSRALSRRPDDEDVAVSLAEGMGQMVAFAPEDQALVASRYRLIDRNPDLRGKEQIARHVSVLAEFIAQRRGEVATALVPRLVSEVVCSAAVAASRYWAVTDAIAEPLGHWVNLAIRPVLHAYGPMLEAGRPSRDLRPALVPQFSGQ
jgi:AcrR family transcriptional regulator